MSQIMDEYIRRYPQLSLPVAEGMSADARYTAIVRRGQMPETLENPFIGSPEDAQLSVDSPIGAVSVLYLAERADFERFVRVMRWRCEPQAIPPSMGALTIIGIINWHKINAHKREWLAENSIAGWGDELRRFAAEPQNCRDTVLVVSKGPYSALPACEAGFDEETWLAHSLKIRAWHETTHLVCRSLWPEHVQAVRDEAIADCIGLIAALGHYDAVLAAKLLGVEGDGCREGGRLRNYIPGGEPDAKLLESVRSLIALLAEEWAAAPAGAQAPFEFLRLLETRGTGLELF